MINLAKKACQQQESMASLEKQENVVSSRAKHNYHNLFHALLSSDMPEEEKRPERMAHEGFEILLAGSDTTARTMGIAVYHLLANKDIALRLREELKTVMPTPQCVIDLRVLESLPWLVRTVNRSQIAPHGSHKTQQLTSAPRYTEFHNQRSPPNRKSHRPSPQPHSHRRRPAIR